MIARGRPRSRGWWYPWIFVGAMLVVVSVNGVMIYFAVASWTGLETEDYYEKGLAYNQELAAQRAQRERGWTMQLSFVAQQAKDEHHRGSLRLRFADRDGRPLDDLSVEVKLVRPTREGVDTAVSVVHRGAGTYAGVVDVPLAGQWDVRIHARRGGEHYRARHRLRVP